MSKRTELFARPFQRILNILYPAQCRHCAEPLSPPLKRATETNHPHLFFCESCWAGLRRLPAPHCPCCAKPFSSAHALSESPDHLCGVCRLSRPAFSRALTPFCYEGVLSKAIQVLKYQQGRGLALALAELLLPETKNLKVDVITGIALHPSRLRQREFNQSLLIARALASRLGLPFESTLISRLRATPPQVGLSKKARGQNVKGAFEIPGNRTLKSKKILLVDDVYTTGATLNEGTKALLKAGAESVIVAAPARMLFGEDGNGNNRSIFDDKQFDDKQEEEKKARHPRGQRAKL